MKSLTLEDIAWIMLFTNILDDSDTLMLVLLTFIQENLLSEPEHKKYKRFRLRRYNEHECRIYFRFGKQQLRDLHDCLGMQDYYVCRNGTVWNSFEGLCLLLRRLAYPNRLRDLIPMFGRAKEELSMILNHCIFVIYDLHHHRLECINQPWMNYELFANHVHMAGAPLDNIWAFIDGTLCYICRPIEGQKSVYSGHKRRHGLKFQSLTCPNGMMAHFWGPFSGARHDSAMYNESGLDQLIRNVYGNNRRGLAIYGDSAYALRNHFMTPYKGGNLNDNQKEFNREMSRVRCSVEWSFGQLNSTFSFVDYSKNLKVYLQPVAMYYLVGALFTNAHTCCYENQVSKYFGLKPPTLREYFY